MSPAPHARAFPYLAIGYTLFLIQFALLGLFVGSAALGAASGVITGLGIGWAIVLAASLGSFARQAAVNRRGGGHDAGPVRHLIAPAESTERIAEYRERYRHEPTADVAALPQRSRNDQRVAA